MRRFAHPLVWLPLGVLTLFFALCGWRNAHLSNDEDSVLVQGAVYAARQVQGQTVRALNFSNKNARAVEVALNSPHSIKRKLLTSGSGKLLISDGMPMPWIQVGDLVLHNRFHATAQVGFGEPRRKKVRGYLRAMKVTFTRSPLAFWSNEWRMNSADLIMHSGF